MILPLLKSIATYLDDVDDLEWADASDVSVVPNLLINNEARKGGVVAVGSSGGITLPWVMDGQISPYCQQNAANGLSWVGVTFPESTQVDYVRYYQPTDSHIPTDAILDTYSGGSWAAGAGPKYELKAGWNVVPLYVAMNCSGVRLSSAAQNYVKCGEFEVYSESAYVPKPRGFAEGGIYVVHADLDLSSKSLPLVTVEWAQQTEEEGDIVGFSAVNKTMIYVGIHADLEDVVDHHARWVRLVLENAWGNDAGGNPRFGIPVSAKLFPLSRRTSDGWWYSGQRNWAGPVTTYRNGVVLAYDEIDLIRGRVYFSRVDPADDIRADFGVGLLEYRVVDVVRAGLDGPAKIQHRHSIYLGLETLPIERSLSNVIL
jgi:hypothetical protein